MNTAYHSASHKGAVTDSDASAYIDEKQRQLAELGYEGSGLEGEALIWIEGPEHFYDIVLGLAPIRPKRLDLFDNRFGIRIPYQGSLLDSIEEFRLELPHLGDCDVIVRGGGFAPAAVFSASMFVPPPVVNGTWLLIRHPDFTLTFRKEGVNFETSDTFGGGLKILDAWATLIRALSYLAGNNARISIEMKASDASLLSLPVELPLNGPYLDQLPAMTKFLDGWQRLLEVVGMRSIEPFAFEAIWDANAAAMAVDMLLSPNPVASLEFDALDGVMAASSVEAIYFNSCSFGGSSISFCVQVTLKSTGADGGCYRSSAFKPLDVRAAVANIEEYGMEEAHRLGLTIVINPSNLTFVDANRDLRDEKVQSS